MLKTVCLSDYLTIKWNELFHSITAPFALCQGEPLEITALEENLPSITDAIEQNLQWFVNTLISKAFITQNATQAILGLSGVAPAHQTGQLLNSVFAKIRGSQDKRHWFNEFVDIFSHDRAYDELVRKLQNSIQNPSETA